MVLQVHGIKKALQYLLQGLFYIYVFSYLLTVFI
jgi:hypothetical protein